MRSAASADETPPERTGRLADAAVLFAVALVLSRLLGLARNVIIADVFGNTREIEAYFAAFRIPDTMFMLVSGGALASAFIPVFSGLLAQDDQEHEAWRMASTVFTTVTTILAVFALVAFVLAPQIMGFLTGGFTSHQESLTVDLTRIMLLQPIFLGAAALISATLQSYERFVLTALAPLAYNAVVVVGALLGKGLGVGSLAWSVVLAALAQVLLQLPGLWHEARDLFTPTVDWASQASREVLRLFVPRVLGYSAFQAMLFVTLYLVSRLPHGMLGSITYSWLLISFPVGALGTAAATAAFPRMSRLGALDEREQLRLTVNRGLRFVLFLALPAAVGLIVLRRPIVNLLYHHGPKWTVQDTENTAFALLFYAMAVAPLVAIEILPRVFYSIRDTVTPVRIAALAVAIDVVLSILLVHLLPRSSGQGGLALATAIATSLQAIWLARAIDVRLGGIGMRTILGTLLDSSIASAVMAVVLYVSLDIIVRVFPQQGIGALATVLVEVTLGGVTFLAVVYQIGSPELHQVTEMVLRRNRNEGSESPLPS